MPEKYTKLLTLPRRGRRQDCDALSARPDGEAWTHDAYRHPGVRFSRSETVCYTLGHERVPQEGPARRVRDGPRGGACETA